MEKTSKSQLSLHLSRISILPPLQNLNSPSFYLESPLPSSLQNLKLQDAQVSYQQYSNELPMLFTPTLDTCTY